MRKSPLLALCGVVLAVWTARGEEPKGQAPPIENSGARSPTQIAAAIGRATVTIRASLQGGSVVSGSGFIVDAAGTIVTNAHVVQDAERVEVRVSGGDLYDVTGVRCIDRKRDIAVLQIPAFGLPTVPLGNSDSVRSGDRVVVIGNALGVFENTVTTGVISGVRDLEGYKLFQMDAAISKGNSGGPVLNDHGEVIAITVAKMEAGESLNFAVPINYARGLLQLEPKPGTDALRDRASGVGDLFSGDPQGSTRRWKSLLTGTVKIVRVQADFVYIETVMPEKVAAAGGMTMGELKKQGDKWVGKVRSRLPCFTADGSRSKTCSFENPIEVSVLTPTRIEGFVIAPPVDAEFKCRTCEYAKPATKQEFVWIPE
jgi:S1-C subfamily serine protease